STTPDRTSTSISSRAESARTGARRANSSSAICVSPLFGSVGSSLSRPCLPVGGNDHGKQKRGLSAHALPASLHFNRTAGVQYIRTARFLSPWSEGFRALFAA